jgi:hypothetical protein
MLIFLSEATSHLGSFLTDEMWRFFWPTFFRLTEQKKGLQVSSVQDKTKAFKKKLGSLIKEVESGHNVFLYSFWDSLSLKMNFNWTLYWRPVWGTWCQTSRSRPTSQEHLTSHFLYLKHPKRIISNDQEWRTERLLLWRKSLKMFKMVNLKAFWWSKRKEYPPISDNAVKFPFVFSNVYLSECGFPSVIYIKSKLKNHIDCWAWLQSEINKSWTRHGKLCLAKQVQLSSHWRFN